MPRNRHIQGGGYACPPHQFSSLQIIHFSIHFIYTYNKSQSFYLNLYSLSPRERVSTPARYINKAPSVLIYTNNSDLFFDMRLLFKRIFLLLAILKLLAPLVFSVIFTKKLRNLFNTLRFRSFLLFSFFIVCF